MTFTIHSTNYPQWASVLATLLAVLVALFGQQFWSWWRRPRLCVQFEEREPFVRSGVPAIMNSSYQVFGRTFWRVRVENVGRETARDCVAKIVITDDHGSLTEVFDPMQLRWSSLTDDLESRPATIPRHDVWFADMFISVTFDDPRYAPPDDDERPRGVLHIARPRGSEEPGHPTWLPVGTSYATIRVLASNAEAEIRLRVDIDPDQEGDARVRIHQR